MRGLSEDLPLADQRTLWLQNVGDSAHFATAPSPKLQHVTAVFGYRPVHMSPVHMSNAGPLVHPT